MIEHLKAIEAAIAGLGYPTWRVFASKVSAQYVVLKVRGWDGPAEAQLSGPAADVDTDLRVTAVAGTPDGVAIMLNRIRDMLSPDSVSARIPMTGWRLETKFTRSEFIDVDVSTTITATGLHPAWGVDTYRMTAQPL